MKHRTRGAVVGACGLSLIREGILNPERPSAVGVSCTCMVQTQSSFSLLSYLRFQSGFLMATCILGMLASVLSWCFSTLPVPGGQELGTAGCVSAQASQGQGHQKAGPPPRPPTGLLAVGSPSHGTHPHYMVAWWLASPEQVISK